MRDDIHRQNTKLSVKIIFWCSGINQELCLLTCQKFKLTRKKEIMNHNDKSINVYNRTVVISTFTTYRSLDIRNSTYIYVVRSVEQCRCIRKLNMRLLECSLTICFYEQCVFSQFLYWDVILNLMTWRVYRYWIRWLCHTATRTYQRSNNGASSEDKIWKFIQKVFEW